MLSKDMKRASKRPDWIDLVPKQRTLLERLVPSRSPRAVTGGLEKERPRQVIPRSS